MERPEQREPAGGGGATRGWGRGLRGGGRGLRAEGAGLPGAGPAGGGGGNPAGGAREPGRTPSCEAGEGCGHRGARKGTSPALPATRGRLLPGLGDVPRGREYLSICREGARIGDPRPPSSALCAATLLRLRCWWRIRTRPGGYGNRGGGLVGREREREKGDLRPPGRWQDRSRAPRLRAGCGALAPDACTLAAGTVSHAPSRVPEDSYLHRREVGDGAGCSPVRMAAPLPARPGLRRGVRIPSPGPAGLVQRMRGLGNACKLSGINCDVAMGVKEGGGGEEKGFVLLYLIKLGRWWRNQAPTPVA